MMMHNQKEISDNLDYISYSNLKVLSEKEQSEEYAKSQIKNLIEVPQWKKNFDALLYYRSLNKQNCTILKTILPDIIKKIDKLSFSIRSGVKKETLIFCYEIIQNYKLDNTNKGDQLIILNKVLYILLHSTFSGPAFISEEAKTGLKNSLITNVSLYDFEVSIELIDIMKNDKPIISDNSYEMFDLLIKKIKLTEVNDKEIWTKFCIKIEELYNKKRDIYTKKAVNILKYIIDNVTKEKFENILTDIGKKENYEIYLNWIKLGEKKSSSKMSFKDFKKQSLSKMKKDNATEAKGTNEELSAPRKKEEQMEIDKMDEI